MDITALTNDQGFLINTADWNESIAELLADKCGVVLSPAHWEIIFFIRAYYQQYKHLPNMRVFIKAVANTFGVDKGNSRYLHSLFPEAPLRDVCKVAGLPKPPTCL